MAKVLLLSVLFIFLFTASRAQSHADSVANRPPDTTMRLVDTVAKRLAPDTAPKQQAADTVIKHKTDTVVKHLGADTIIKPPQTDTATRQPKSDTIKHLADTIKLLPVDSSTNHKPGSDSLVKKPPADTLIKHSSDTVVTRTGIDTLVKHLPVDSLIKRPPTDTLTKNQSTDSIRVKPVHTDSVSRRKPPDNTVITRPVAKPAVTKKPAVAAVAEIKHSPLKTIDDERYNMLLKGEDFDHMSLVGELNHYPLPEQALKYKIQLALSPGQITKLKALATELQRKKIEMGAYIVGNEKMLDSLFHSHRVVDGTIIFYTNRYGLYLGELRNAILQACYNTEAILSTVQIKKLEGLEAK
jgi:hypothetical protein